MAKSLSIIAALVGVLGAGIGLRGAMIRARDFADIKRQIEWATLAALAVCRCCCECGSTLVLVGAPAVGAIRRKPERRGIGRNAQTPEQTQLKIRE